MQNPFDLENVDMSDSEKMAMACSELTSILLHTPVLAPRITKPKPTPKVGDTVAILHQVKRSAGGTQVLGLQRCDRTSVETIDAVYLDNMIRTASGDVWEVRVGGNAKVDKGAQWATVNPLLDKEA